MTMTTLDDVARLAGVSRMTASNALRGKTCVRRQTAQRVLQAARQLDYRPDLAARRLSSGRSHIIGLSVADFDLIFPADLAACLSDEAGRRGYQVLAQQTRCSQDSERTMLDHAVAQLCDGAVVCWPSSDVEALTRYAAAHPLVVLDGFAMSASVDCVLTPCRAGMASAMDHLLQQGYRRPIIIGANPDEAFASPPNTSSGLRLHGALDALKRHGVAFREDMVIACGWDREQGYVVTADLIARNVPFDALCCLNDPIAIGALKALSDAKMNVPRDVAVIGFDGVRDGQYTTPGLSSIVIDPAVTARACLDLLLSRLEHRDTTLAPRTQELPYTLARRGSAERAA